jgi:hypothetical protein
MKYYINNIEYNFMLEDVYPVTECKKKSVFANSPFLYEIKIKIACDQRLTTYPREILGRLLAEWVKKGIKPEKH